MIIRDLKILLISALLLFATASFADSLKLPYLNFETKNNSLTILKRAPSDGLSVGSYTIYVYDSENVQLIDGVVIQRDGEVYKAWVEPLEEGDFRVWVQSVSAGSGSYGELDGFVFDGDKLKKINIKKANKNLLSNYRGHDSYFFKDGVIYREFPIYKNSDSNANPTGGKKCLRLDGSSFEWKASPCPSSKLPNQSRH
ncbi:MAG: PliI family lysozyme inhibitor of I-type lysozyme [Campylobacterales bacterium]